MTILAGMPAIDVDGWMLGVQRQPAADMGGPICPKLVVMHYTGSGSVAGTSDWLTRKDEVYVSAHVVIGRDGDVVQLVPFRRKAYHAGRSSWNGEENCNEFSIGVELVNWGWLRREDDTLVSATGARVPLNQGTMLRHSNESLERYWQRYTAVQLEAAARVVSACAWIFQIPAEGIVGHDAVSPGRKVDPGPAFPWAWFRARSFGAAAEGQAKEHWTGLQD